MRNDEIGVVVIGRNEGKRLVRCLASLPNASFVVYVDSCSSDDSILNAKNKGVDVLHLDMSIPFSAARARNVGWKYLITKYPAIKFIQFVDGDCELFSTWLETAHNFMQGNANYAVVFGRLNEKFPEKSVYNKICDEEWNSSVGVVASCGGNAFIRVDPLAEINGYDEGFIAGEEPELCYRLRKNNWKIASVEENMALHDANILRFQQYWQRSKRCGFAYALALFQYGTKADRFNIKGLLRAYFWSFLFFIIVVTTTFCDRSFGWFLLIFPVQIIRMFFKRKQLNTFSFKYSVLSLVSKLAEFQGSISFLISKAKRGAPKIIEYK
jgi:glycosyltransferase involved in cell wall biosynthesis